jgi:hypothetical protein
MPCAVFYYPIRHYFPILPLPKAQIQPRQPHFFIYGSSAEFLGELKP